MSNQPIFSVAIALPTILLSALPSLAKTPTTTPAQVNPPQPTAVLVTPGLQVPSVGSVVGNPLDYVIAPGEGGSTRKPPKGPKPPRRDIDFSTPGKVVQPVIPSTPINQGINFAPGH